MSQMDAPNDPVPEQTPNTEYRNRLDSTLQRIVQPLADYAKFALGYTTGTATHWICRHENCVCGSGQPVPGSTDGIARIRIAHRNIPAGEAILCSRGGEECLAGIARNLIEEALHLIELEYDDEDLIHELGSNWESLHSIYEISTDLRNMRNLPDILGGILDRIVANRPGLHAVLWIEKEGRLVPSVTRGTKVDETRNTRDGLLGRALNNRVPVIINGRSIIQAERLVEPELAGADNIAVMPITTRDRLVGALEVWQEPGSGTFDTPTIRLFEVLALQAAMVVESNRAYNISLVEERLRGEFEIGGRIQETLLLGRPPVFLPALDIGVLTVPSHAVDGDFFDFLPCGDDCLDVFIGDVMGKGIPAALVGAAAKSDLLRAFGRLTAASLNRQLPAPREIVTYVHQQLTGQLIGLESFISLYYCRFDLRHSRMDFVDCGHPRAIHYHAATKTLDFLAGDNMPLGIVEGGNYTQSMVQFAPEDLFFFYSDGVTEAHAPGQKLYGEDRLKSFFLKHADLKPAQLCAKIRESVAEYTGSSSVSDDLTCLCIKVGVLSEKAPSTRWTMEFSSYLEFLPSLRSWIRGVYRCAGIENTQILDLLELAVTETTSNIIRHAYRGETGKKIIVEAQALEDRLAVTLTHWGSRFRPSDSSPRMPDSTLEHGYGLYIISKVVDRITYFEGPNGTDCVRLEKFL